MHCRRAIRPVLVYALLGAVATVLTSWAIHAAQFWRMHQGSRMAYGWTRIESADSPFWRGSDAALFEAWKPYRVQPGDAEVSEATRLYFESPIRRMPIGWRVVGQQLNTFQGVVWNPPFSHEVLVCIDAGWPARSMRQGAFAGNFGSGTWVDEETRSSGVSLHGGFQVRPWTTRANHTPATNTWAFNPIDRFAFPLLPIWPGFLINTFFYALLLFALVRGPRVVRRAIRRRGGRCVGCGYDRKGLDAQAACPECGAGAVAP